MIFCVKFIPVNNLVLCWLSWHILTGKLVQKAENTCLLEQIQLSGVVAMQKMAGFWKSLYRYIVNSFISIKKSFSSGTLITNGFKILKYLHFYNK